MASHNGAATLPFVLEAYCALQAPDGDWLLRFVDDGSFDATADIVWSFRQRLPLAYTLMARSGKCEALNIAIEQTLAEDPSQLVVLADDDAAPDRHWLRILERCAAAQGGADIVEGQVRKG